MKLFQHRELKIEGSYTRLSTLIMAIRQNICHWPFTNEIKEIWHNDHNIFIQKRVTQCFNFYLNKEYLIYF